MNILQVSLNLVDIPKKNKKGQENQTKYSKLTENLNTEIEKQKEINRKAFKIKSHSNNSSQKSFILKFKDILSVCFTENKMKNSLLVSLKNQSTENARSKSEVPFTKLLSQKMKKSKFQLIMKQILRKIEIEISENEKLEFGLERLSADLGQLKVNIYKHSVFLAKLNENQTEVNQIKRAVKFKRFNFNMIMQSRVKEVEKAFITGAELQLCRNKCEKKQKNKIEYLEENNALLQIEINNLSVLNQELKNQIGKMDPKTTHKSKQKLINGKTEHQNLDVFLLKTIEFSIIRDFKLFKTVFLICYENFLDGMENKNNELEQIKILIEKIEMKENNLESINQNPMFQKNNLSEIKLNLTNSKIQKRSLTLSDFMNKNLKDFEEVYTLIKKLCDLPIQFLAEVFLSEYSELNSKIKNNLKYFCEFQKILFKNYEKFEDKLLILNKTVLENEIKQEFQPSLSSFNTKSKTINNFQVNIQIIFSIRKYLINFTMKIKRASSAINFVCSTYGIDLEIKLGTVFERNDKLIPINPISVDSINCINFYQSDSKNSRALQRLSSKFPLFFECDNLTQKNQFYFYENEVLEICDFVQFFVKFKQFHSIFIEKNQNPKTFQNLETKSFSNKFSALTFVKGFSSNTFTSKMTENRKIDSINVKS